MDLKVKVIPRARKTEVVGWLADRLKVRVAAPADSGKANQALLDLLGEILQTRDIEIIAGQASPFKTIRITSMTADEVRSRLPLSS